MLLSGRWKPPRSESNLQISQVSLNRKLLGKVEPPVVPRL